MDRSYIEYLDSDGTIVQLLKALYGCKQSGFFWYRDMKETLLNLNFKINPFDPCVFSRGEGDDECIILLSLMIPLTLTH